MADEVEGGPFPSTSEAVWGVGPAPLKAAAAAAPSRTLTRFAMVLALMLLAIACYVYQMLAGTAVCVAALANSLF